MGVYSSVPIEENHSIVVYKSALNMAKNKKDSNEIVSLINKNKVKKDDNKEALSILNNIMLEISENPETTEDDIILLDKIIHEISSTED